MCISQKGSFRHSLVFCWSFIVLHKVGVSCLVALTVLTTHTFAPGVKFSDVFQLLTRSHWSFLTCFNYSVSLVLSIQLLSIFLSRAELVWSGGISLIPFQIWNNWSTQNSFSINWFLVLYLLPKRDMERTGSCLFPVYRRRRIPSLVTSTYNQKIILEQHQN